ncbi:MAG TPA: permease [Pseudonocardia sp.]|nr:permease [Pseudonocardia sp.]
MRAVGNALALAGTMTWEILWALILGFALSALVQAVIHKSTVLRLMGDDRPRTLARSALLGAASSSCSYAAVALARSLFRKGADFTAAMAFEIGSTNLVVELGVILALLLGWQFTLAEFVGGPLMIVLVAVLFRLFVRRRLVDAARAQAERGLAGSMKGHAAMDMSVQAQGSFLRRLLSGEGFTSVAHVFVMEWAAVWRDIVIGLLIAGAVGAWVPDSWWRTLFAVDHPLLSALWGPIVGPVVAILAFVCSIGNVPLAAVLWNGGISFGGVVAFIFADLLILPILNIYRRYYGIRMTIVLLATFYAAMVGAGYLVELLFGVTGLIPAHRHAMVMSEGLSWNYTTWLNIVFLLLAAVLVARFIRTGGIPMLAIMGGGPDAQEHHHEHHTADEQRSDHEHHRHEHHRHEHHGHGVTDPGEAPSSPPRPDVEP